MNFIKNSSIKQRLIVTLSSIFIIIVFFSVFIISGLKEVQTEYQYLIEKPIMRTVTLKNINFEFARLRRFLREVPATKGNKEDIEWYKNTGNEAFQKIENFIPEYIKAVNDDTKLSQSEKQVLLDALEKIRIALLVDYKQMLEELYVLAEQYKVEEMDLFADENFEIGYNLSREIDTAAEEANKYATNHFKVCAEKTEEKIKIISIIGIVIIVLLVILSVILVRSIIEPINNLINTGKKVVDGDLSIKLHSNKKDEIGILSNMMGDMVNIFSNVAEEINKLTEELSQGEVDSRIDVKKFNGDYKILVEGINTMAEGSIEDLRATVSVAKAYSNGDFEEKLPQMPGRKKVINEYFDNLQNNLKSISLDVKKLINAAINGKLDRRVDSRKYKGDWFEITDGLNRVLDAVIEPVQEAAEVLDKIAEGKLDVSVKGDYKGHHALIKDAINGTIDTISGYISEVKEILGEMSKKNLDVKIEREYIGDFIEIKNAITEIVDIFNIIMKEINSSSIQVASGASQVSNSSVSLAHGSAEQASAVSELNATIGIMLENIHKNAKNADNTNNLADEVEKIANEGNRDMQELLVSMKEINEASESISKIIKVIDDIAFQTNLLALNAAVEAARAGEHGKGFAVVAEEVRDLAGRSKAAAAETSLLISSSIEKTSVGAKLANITADVLENIVEQISEMSLLIEEVSVASKEQVQAIEQINIGINQISEVTVVNTATSQETAAAAEELSSQTENVKNLLAEFKLR